MKYGAVILAGGKSSRMGIRKSELKLNGTRFLDKLVYELSGFQELLVSVDDQKKHPEIEYPMVSDTVPGCGPMGGLYAALAACTCDALVVVPCDVPLFSKAMADQMCGCLDAETDAVLASTIDGREHPLCGVYKKSCQNVFGQCLKDNNYRMQDALAKLRVKKYQAGEENSWRFRNINTPLEFQKLTNTNCLAICGWKNAGKTTLIEKLIPLLSEKGLKVAAVKHDGHEFEPDVPGTDSYRFFQAGACASLIYDHSKYLLSRRMSITEEDAAALIPEADLILMEGFKWSRYPKIEIVRRENGKGLIPDLHGRIAYISDMELSVEKKLPVLSLWDAQKIAEFIQKAYVNGELKERWTHEENR